MGRDRYAISCLGIIYFALLPEAALVLGNPQFMVMMPKTLYTETPEKICILLTNLRETVTLSATMETGDGKENLFQDLEIDKDFFNCISVTLPRSLSSNRKRSLSIKIRGPMHNFNITKKVLIKKTESLLFVQTDKQIYTPGQSVKFRIVSMDKNFHPLYEVLPLVHIEDPKMNRIMQWRNVKLENGLIQLSFDLSPEPFKGSYKIVIQKESGEDTVHSFTVEEYVLPKFEVQVKVPKEMTILDETLSVKVCGQYTYGKPVPGHVSLKVDAVPMFTYILFKNDTVPTTTYEEVNLPLDINGCMTRQINASVLHLKSMPFIISSLHVKAKITEEGTGLEINGTGEVYFTNTVTKLTFTKVDSHFRRGIPFTGQVRLVDRNGIPIPNERIFIQLHGVNHHSNVTTDEHGLAQFSIDTTNIKSPSFDVSVYQNHQSPCSTSTLNCWKEEYGKAYTSVRHVYSLSNTGIKLEPIADILPCGQIQTIQVYYLFNEEALSGLEDITFYYLIMAKGSIKQTGTYDLSMKAGELRGSFSISFPVEGELAPAAQFLLYTILPSGEMIGDKAKYEVEKCLSNKVNLSFSPTQSFPGSQAHLQVTASPHSVCALRAVDYSVLLKKPEKELSRESIYNLLPVRDGASFIDWEDWEWDGIGCIDRDTPHPPVAQSEEEDVHDLMKDMNLLTFTNVKIQHPKLCPKIMIMSMLEKGNAVPTRTASTPASIETVRKYFPETWIWDLVAINSSGVAEVKATVPDTITEWKAGVFCLSNNTGFGISPTASLQVFQPFFLEVTMPYSVIRGEAFTMKATVLNYLPKCIQVNVQLASSPDYMAIPLEKDQESYCLCANGRKTVSWLVTLRSLGNVKFSVSAETMTSSELCGTEVATLPENGRKDTVVKTLLVEPEGIKKEYTFSSLVCASDEDGRVPEQLSLTLPPKIVKESARATFSVLGNILSSAIRNIQNLLQMPYGCGEQNMVLFAPNIYVLKYLNETQQITEAIKSKAIGYLHAGYQRELNYKHKDGSYSAFGDKDEMTEGNTWLTAFVLKSFAQAQDLIFIDEKHISQALIWISEKQKENGCFKSSGTLFNNALKGGVDDEITLSAYVTIALQEIPLPATNPVVHKALSCLESFWNKPQQKMSGSQVYTKALLAYAFALAGKQDIKREILKSLDEDAIKEDHAMHWERPQKSTGPKEHFYVTQAPSAEVEMTAYVLLAYLTTQSAPTSEDLTSATQIVKWITKQQNPYGGFSSTQDTVVALQALSRYGAATFVKQEKNTWVTIQSSETFSTKFQVNNTNNLLLQQVSLPDVPGEYSISVSGGGCVYTQAVLKYNVFLEKKESAFTLQVQTLPQICDGPESHKSFQISLEVSYIGSRLASNMVIIDVKMVSGFIPLKSTVKMLEKSSNVSRTEVSINNVLIYVEQVTKKTLSFSFIVVQDIPVRDLKPALVKVYDYYEKDEAAFAEYNAPCSTNSEQGNN